MDLSAICGTCLPAVACWSSSIVLSSCRRHRANRMGAFFAPGSRSHSERQRTRFRSCGARLRCFERLHSPPPPAAGDLRCRADTGGPVDSSMHPRGSYAFVSRSGCGRADIKLGKYVGQSSEVLRAGELLVDVHPRHGFDSGIPPLQHACRCFAGSFQNRRSSCGTCAGVEASSSCVSGGVMKIRLTCALLAILIPGSNVTAQAVKPGQDVLVTPNETGTRGGRLVASLRSDPK